MERRYDDMDVMISIIVNLLSEQYGEEQRLLVVFRREDYSIVDIMIDNNFHRKTLSRSDEEFKTSVKVLGLRVRDLRNMIDNLPLVILEDKFEKIVF